MNRSREGRHTAKASTWLLRHGMVTTLDKAVKLVKRRKVFVRGKLAETKVGYMRLNKSDIEVRDG